MKEPFRFDPFDASQTQNMWERFREIREQAPVSRAGECVFVARYDDAKKVLRLPELFSSAQGFRAPGVEVPLEDRLVGELDPPVHLPIRSLLTSILPAAPQRAAPFTREKATSLFDALASRGGGDLVGELTLLLPTQITMYVLGLPVDDAQQVAEWANELLHSDWPAFNRSERGEGLDGAFPEYAAYIDRHIAARRSAALPPDDLIAGLIGEQVFGEPVSDRQARALISNLILGGISTSTSMLGNLLLHLIERPDQHGQLRSDPALVPAAVEESLRLAPPILYVMRTCVSDTDAIGGFPIRSGERVVVSIASANRDDAVFPDADAFLLTREKPEPHLSFAPGAHLCVGAGLARMTGRVVVEAFTQRFREGDVRMREGFAFEAMPLFMEYGPSRLPVVIADAQA